MRISLFLASFLLLFSTSQLWAQSRPDLLYLTDGSVEKVVIRGENASRKLIQYHPWQGGKDQILSKNFSSIHKIIYSYGVERFFNEKGEEEGSILDEIFGDGEEMEGEILSIPQVENTTLLLADDTNTPLLDYSWTYQRLKLLRPSRYEEVRGRRGRYGSTRERIPQWEKIDLSYVDGVLLPGRVRLQFVEDGGVTINDSTGWVELRNGLRYAAQSIEIRDLKVIFEEYYTRKVFQWDAKDVDYLVWEYHKGAMDFLVPGEESGMDYYPSSDGSRGADMDGSDDGGSTNINDLFEDSEGMDESGSTSNMRTSEMSFGMKGTAKEFSPLVFPVREPSSLLRMKINASRTPTSSQDYSLFPKSGNAENMGDVYKRLLTVFEAKNFQDLQFFPIAGGFVMLTPVEKFQEDGSSASWYERFNIQAQASQKENFLQTAQTISFKSPGFYRMFAVVVSDQGNVYGSGSGSLIEGMSVLDNARLEMPLSSKHKTTFMVYEWNQVKTGSPALLKDRGENKYSTVNHLQKSGLWAEIQK